MAKRAGDDDIFDGELGRLLADTKCDVCFVSLSGKEAADKHYGGKIHAKKLEKWKINWIGLKKQKLEEMESKHKLSLAAFENSLGSDEESEGTEESPNQSSPVSNGQSHPSQLPIKEEKDEDVVKKEPGSPPPVLASGALDPKQLDNMDPAEMRRMLNGSKKKNRWDTPESEEEAVVEVRSDDFSIPTQFRDLMKRCFNRKTGIGYCPICNKLLRSEQEAVKHFKSNRHMEKVGQYAVWLASEAAVLAGTAEPNPPPHRGFYCEVCEADCSSETQLEQHLSGDRHRTNLRLLERELISDPELDKDINAYNYPELWLREQKHCRLCDVPITSLTMAKIHFNGRNHRRAAGLNIMEASKLGEFVSKGDLHCDTCNFNVTTEIEMRAHEAGIRHRLNDKTRAAVISSGGEWVVHQPEVCAPPTYSVQDPGNGWSGASVGLGPGMEAGQMPGAPAVPGAPPVPVPGYGYGGYMPYGAYGGQWGQWAGQQGAWPAQGSWPGQTQGQGAWPGYSQGYPPLTPPVAGFAPGMNPPGWQPDGLPVTKGGVMGWSLKDEEAKKEGEEVIKEYKPTPVTEDSYSYERTDDKKWHCPFCPGKYWSNLVIVRFYHSVTPECKAAQANKVAESGAMLHCGQCERPCSAATPEELLSQCMMNQKNVIYGDVRSYSCWECDMHVSDESWLYKHLAGEKHRWVKKRVDQRLPVFWEPQQIVSVQKQQWNEYKWRWTMFPEFQCLVCKVGFTPMDRYKRHLNSLFHMRKSAGEEIEWIEGGSRNDL